MILRILVLRPGLMVMAGLTECLPVIPVPEQCFISTMWNDVIHNRCLLVLPLCHTPYAQRMCCKVLFTCFLPCSPIAPAGCGADYLRMQGPVLLTELRPRGYQFRTAGMLAWHLWSLWHRLTPPTAVLLYRSVHKQKRDYSPHPEDRGLL